MWCRIKIASHLQVDNMVPMEYSLLYTEITGERLNRLQLHQEL